MPCETVTGDTPTGERDSIIRRFKSGELRCITNANVLTTGFDAPGVDLIAMLRPTLSTALYVQIVGRGTRRADGKENCLVLDFAGNVRRHGPVDAVSVSAPGGGANDTGKVGVDSVLAKPCPECEAMVALACRICPECDHQFPKPEAKHDARADREHGILSSERVPPRMLSVVAWKARLHRKQGAPDSLRIDYRAGLEMPSEWLCFGHSGYARQKACEWWSAHGGATPFPSDADEALRRFGDGEVACPATISLRPRGSYHDIVGRTHHREAA